MWGLKTRVAHLVYALFFFFSSRSRHTRYIGDWSSDVCSSVLAGEQRGRDSHAGSTTGGHIRYSQPAARSEERRVGKEDRSQGWRDYYKKKILLDGKRRFWGNIVCR